MGRISVTRHIEFEASHILTGYEGLCGNLHGHSYALEVTISCSESKRKSNAFNFVLDFSRLNVLLKEYVPDHAFIVNLENIDSDCAESEIYKVLKKYNRRVFEMFGSPSAENMVELFATDIQGILNKEYPDLDCTVDELKLWETTNSHATWRKD